MIYQNEITNLRLCTPVCATYTWHELADPGEELGAACITVNFALNKEAVLAISQTKEGQETKG